MKFDRKLEGCSCHINPPCDFCTSLTEQEYDIWQKSGLNGLRKFLLEKEEELYNEGNKLGENNG